MGARSKRLLVICLTVVVVAIVSTVLYSAKVMNPRVIEELTADPNGERAKKVMLLTFPDDKTLPVNYLHEAIMFTPARTLDGGNHFKVTAHR